METNEEKNKLTYKEMQELLPDYVFNRIVPEEKLKFEEQLPLYPELQDEIRQVKAVFNRIESMDFDKKISARTRNLSVKVNERMASKHIKSRRLSFVNRYLVPTFGLALILFFIFTSKDLFKYNNVKNKIDTSTTSELQVLKNSDAAVLIDPSSTNLDSVVAAATSLATPIRLLGAKETAIDDGAVSNLWSEFVSDNLIFGGVIPQSFLNANSISTNNDLIKDLNDMDEKDFQNILKEIDDVDFNS